MQSSLTVLPNVVARYFFVFIISLPPISSLCLQPLLYIRNSNIAQCFALLYRNGGGNAAGAGAQMPATTLEMATARLMTALDNYFATETEETTDEI